MEPFSAMALLQPFATGAAQSINRPQGPSSAVGQSDPFGDFSGWNVNFGSGSIDSARTDSPRANRYSAAAPAGDAMANYLPYILIGAGLLVVWRMTKKR